MELEKIEPFHTLGFRMEQICNERVTISVPLSGNRNDKGTMFAGSVYSAMVLAGWKLCVEQARSSGLCGDIVVRDSGISYLRPIKTDLLVTAIVRDAPRKTLRDNYAFDISVSASNADGKTCAKFNGSYRLVRNNGLTSRVSSN
jgi:thioesterase domain-containing protein